MAYLFNYAGKPWRTQEIVNQICKEFYTNTPNGLIGNEDCGQMSAWYVLSAMGFYPVTPGDGKYILGTPIFDKVKINLENGKTFIVNANRNKDENFYVQHVKLNAVNYSKTYLLHEDILKGGMMEFHLGSQPNKLRGSSTADMPVNAITENLIVPVPYFDMPTNKFRKNLMINLKTIETNTDIYYKIMRPNIRSVFVKYTKPFSINENTLLEVYAKKGVEQSKTVNQQFYKMPDHKLIKVLSKVHSMYTAGGTDALIDGIIGTTNWRTGEWHSYFDNDFEAIIDLKSVRQVNYIGIHVLQDVSPWILYPKEMIVETSDDGKIFSPLKKIANTIPALEGKAETQEIGFTTNIKTRFLRIKAINGGPLPEWHESAGSPSHLFIDEVIVK